MPSTGRPRTGPEAGAKRARFEGESFEAKFALGKITAARRMCRSATSHTRRRPSRLPGTRQSRYVIRDATSRENSSANSSNSAASRALSPLPLIAPLSFIERPVELETIGHNHGLRAALAFIYCETDRLRPVREQAAARLWASLTTQWPARSQRGQAGIACGARSFDLFLGD